MHLSLGVYPAVTLNPHTSLQCLLLVPNVYIGVKTGSSHLIQALPIPNRAVLGLGAVAWPGLSHWLARPIGLDSFFEGIKVAET